MIFQDPSSALNPVLTIGKQISEPLRRHKGFLPSKLVIKVYRYSPKSGYQILSVNGHAIHMNSVVVCVNVL